MNTADAAELRRLTETIRRAADLLEDGQHDDHALDLRRAADQLEAIASVVDVTLGEVLTFGQVVGVLRKGAAP